MDGRDQQQEGIIPGHRSLRGEKLIKGGHRPKADFMRLVLGYAHNFDLR